MKKQFSRKSVIKFSLAAIVRKPEAASLDSDEFLFIDVARKDGSCTVHFEKTANFSDISHEEKILCVDPVYDLLWRYVPSRMRQFHCNRPSGM